MLRSMALKDLNPHIICVLCGGYLIDATTIIECLHSFCRSCIVRWLQTSYHCPVCDTEVHKTRPFLNIRPDHVLQDIVYKMIPGLYDKELQGRKDFQAEIDKQEQTEQQVSPKEEKEKEDKKQDDIIDDPVCLTLEYYGTKRYRGKEKPVFPTRYLRCSSKMTVNVLKKFVIMKFSIPRSHEAEIVRSDEILSDQLTMKELSRIYGLHSKSFLDLQYVFMGTEEHAAMNEEAAPKHKKFRPLKLVLKNSPQPKKFKPSLGDDQSNFKTETLTVNSSEPSPAPSQDNKINNGLAGLASLKDKLLTNSSTTPLASTEKTPMSTTMECPDTPESDKQVPEFPSIGESEPAQVGMEAV